MPATIASKSKTARKSPARLRRLEEAVSRIGTRPFSQTHMPNPSVNSLAQPQHRVADEPRGIFLADQAGVDDKMILQRVVDVGVEISLQIAGAGLFLFQTKTPRLGRRFVVIAADAFDAVIQRRDEADVQDVRQFRRAAG